MKIFPIKAAEMTYDVEDSRELRRKLIELRDAALAQNNFPTTILLSHTVAWIHQIIKLHKDEL